MLTKFIKAYCLKVYLFEQVHVFASPLTIKKGKLQLSILKKMFIDSEIQRCLSHQKSTSNDVHF